MKNKEFQKILAYYAVGQMSLIIVDQYLIQKDEGVEFSEKEIEYQKKEIDKICANLILKAEKLEKKFNQKYNV